MSELDLTAAVEAAARALGVLGGFTDWSPYEEHQAQAALTAAAPLIEAAVREKVAQEIEVEMRRHDHAQIGFSAVGDAYAHAARIARGQS